MDSSEAINQALASNTARPTGQATGIFAERRRPGRPASVNPHLLPLLRGAETVDVPPPVLILAEDVSKPPLVGIAYAMLLSSVLWCVVIVAGWVFTR